MKRAFDLSIATAGLFVLSPVLAIIAALIWLQDYRSPLYRGQRVGRGAKLFRMAKFRSMTKDAHLSGVASTALDDNRITPIGAFLRRFKLDELPQLWNVLLGEMSLVGPRPQVPADVDLYTDEERLLLSVRPGITDFASIVFSDEGTILQGSSDPDLSYNQLIRPWKSRLALFYIRNHGFKLDLRIIALTAYALVSRERALQRLQRMLSSYGADSQLIELAGRTCTLVPTPPPGASQIVSSYGQGA